MVECNKLNLELSSSQLSKLKDAVKKKKWSNTKNRQ